MVGTVFIARALPPRYTYTSLSRRYPFESHLHDMESLQRISSFLEVTPNFLSVEVFKAKLVWIGTQPASKCWATGYTQYFQRASWGNPSVRRKSNRSSSAGRKSDTTLSLLGSDHLRASTWKAGSWRNEQTDATSAVSRTGRLWATVTAICGARGHTIMFPRRVSGLARRTAWSSRCLGKYWSAGRLPYCMIYLKAGLFKSFEWWLLLPCCRWWSLYVRRIYQYSMRWCPSEYFLIQFGRLLIFVRRGLLSMNNSTYLDANQRQLKSVFVIEWWKSAHVVPRVTCDLSLLER